MSSGEEEDDLELDIEDPGNLDEETGGSRNRSGTTFLLSGWVQTKMEEEEKEARS